VLTALLHSGQLEFTTITRNAALSDGNLSAHAAKLEKAGFVTIRKSFRKRTPTTVLRITDLGMEAIESYWATIGWILESISAARERA
jgi:DNA-binding MarR family transcriptional regulator